MAHNNSELFSLRIVCEEAISFVSKTRNRVFFFCFPAHDDTGRSLCAVGEVAREVSLLRVCSHDPGTTHCPGATQVKSASVHGLTPCNCSHEFFIAPG